MAAHASEFSFEALEPLLPVTPQVRAPSVPTAAEQLAAAHAEAEQIRAAAREQGYQDGYMAGQAAALAESKPAAEALAAAVSGARAEALRAAGELEEAAVELALMLAERIVAGAVAVRPEGVVEVVRNAIRGLVERERLTLLVNPEDLVPVSEAMAAMQVELGGIEHWEVQAERRVARGGAIVRHAHGDVDARVETKLERAREVVEAALAETA